MALVSLRQLLDHAAEHDYGIPAFNVNNLEQIQAIMQAAENRDSPVILQASAGARKYAGEAFLRRLVEAAIESWPDIPVCMHQDHGASAAVCQASIRSGFSSVMMDGSLLADMKTPASYEYNVAVTRQVADMAHCVGVSVEGELGCLGSLESGQAGEEDGSGAEGVLSHEQLLTDPEQAADFVARTGVDALAIAIGTSHGAYKFTRKPTGDILAIDRIRAIHERIPNTHLVMHGSSSVPQEWLQIIREHGGDIRETYGVPVQEICEGIKNGVRKVNIDTDIRLAMTGAMRRSMMQNTSEFDPRKFFKEATAAARQICEQRFDAFGCAGRASGIKPVPLEQMARIYEQQAVAA
ncbi:fructose-bisphosphate aldolase [Advenella kashmirensis W13003]|uniref:Fructose-1,6-bisphosphate aldolase n=1 Tax=Advenella kashmirensis W13003 TaxID=1424334 RepID=V8QM78_9BURK|nr:class II fructose-bisphosphate aldolase [Advenella kashmirensis]ETF00420.1 fructose-bisphosphate aldolase [Advenella kashmirensis W13003]